MVDWDNDLEAPATVDKRDIAAADYDDLGIHIVRYLLALVPVHSAGLLPG